MSKKYDMVYDNSVQLYRIIAAKRFGMVMMGDIGGFIENEINLSHYGDCWVFDNARIFDNAIVRGNARIFDNVRVCGNAIVSGDATVRGSAEIFDNAIVRDNATVRGNAEIFDNATVRGNAEIFDNAIVRGDAEIFGDLLINKSMLSVIRSDGHTFFIAKDKKGIPIVSAGCRYFTIEEAYEHWNQTRGGTPLGIETINILDFLIKNM